MVKGIGTSKLWIQSGKKKNGEGNKKMQKKKKEEGKGSDQAMKKGKEIGNSESKIPVEKKNVAYYVLSEENIALKWHLSSLQREYIKKKKQQRLYSCFQGLISVYETHYIM